MMSNSWTITDPSSSVDMDGSSPRRPPHPGQVLQFELIEPLDLTTDKVAEAIEWPAVRLVDFIEGRISVDPDLAIRLAHAFSTTAEFWMNLQIHHDLEMVRRFGAPDLAGLPVLHAAE